MNAVKSAPVSAAVGMWNYLDAEHATYVHPGYSLFQVAHQESGWFIILQVIRPPIFSFLKNAAWMAFRLKSKTSFENYTVQHGIPVLTSIEVIEISKDVCEFHMNYKFYLFGWRIIMEPILKFLVPRWIENIWQEDLELKLRRQKMLRKGFKDFVGLPKAIEDRIFEGELKFDFPVPRPPDSPVDQMFKFRNSVIADIN